MRDHCPYCLWGRHMDNVPGDRAATCMGLMKPVELERSGDEYWIHYDCTGCSHRWRVRAHPEDRLDRFSAEQGGCP